VTPEPTPNSRADSTIALGRVGALSENDALAVRRLVSSAPDAADNPQLSEQALLNLRVASGVQHVLAREESDEITGYAQVTSQPPDDEDPAGHSLIELATAVGRGALAHGLIRESMPLAQAQSAAAPVRLWAHGEHSPVHEAAKAAGFAATRTLFQLRRPLAGEPTLTEGELTLPKGVRLRDFVPGQDDAAWLAVNAAAFATHPEQGGWTQTELTERINSDWFDPAGFLLAVRDEELLGFHWTKVHRGGPKPLGEVYVIGVAPSAQGMKLGKTLLVAGLRHLIADGLDTVLLYVDESNTTAVQLYRRMGLTTFAADVQYSHA
jgi:mycothiol synthase